MIDEQPPMLPADGPKGARKTARREARAHRILDAAAELILRWGYDKTTIDDVARKAGVAKGTIYLHWKTREDLFRALVLRERVAMALDIKAHVAADPTGATLRGMLKYSALALLGRPLMKAVLLQDMAIVGKLVHREHTGTVFAERMAGFAAYLDLLRDHGLIRTDITPGAQVYVLSAVFMGFFLIEPLMPPGYTLPDEHLADLLAETVHRMLRADDAPADDDTASEAFRQYLNRATTLAERQFRQSLATDTSPAGDD